MKTLLKTGALCAAFALFSSAAQAFDILHVASADSADYSAFIVGKSGTWTHVASGLTAAGTVGGDLDRVTDFPINGTHGGTGIKVRDYLESFDLIIIGNSVTSGNFVDGANGADWAGITKPVLFHPSLAARALGGRPGMFSADNFTITYGNPDDTVRVSTSALSDTIFNGVTSETDLYNGTSTETINTTATFGGGELISKLTDGTISHHGIVYWNAGVANGVGLIMAGKRAFLPLRNAANSSTTLTDDGKLVLGNLIDELLVPAAPVFLPPTGVISKSGIASVNLTWTASTGATSYNVKRSETAGGPYTIVSTAGAVTTTSFSDTGLTNGTTYYYVISAVDDSPVMESANSAEVNAAAVAVIQPAISILFVANSDSAIYKNFASNGQFANNTWTQKATGLTGNDLIGGDLDRLATFTGTNGGTDITVRSYMESFDLIIVSGPTTSGNLIDGTNGADWAELTKPVIFHSNAVVRAAGGRPGMFSGDNFLTVTLATPADTVQVSTSPLSAALLAGVTSVADLYGFATADVIAGVAAFGNGEHITTLTDGTTNLNHYGLVFWASGDITGAGNTLAANRAFLPLKGSIDDLTADGKVVLVNLINQIRLPQVTPANPYGEWAAVNISTIDPLAIPAFASDAENDGLSNGLEWILGGDPLVPDSANVHPTTVGDASTGLTLVFNRAADSASSTTLTVDWDTDLDAFANSITIGTSDVGASGNNPTVDIDAPSVGKVTVNIPAANAAGGRVFARLKAQLNP